MHDMLERGFPKHPQTKKKKIHIYCNSKYPFSLNFLLQHYKYCQISADLVGVIFVDTGIHYRLNCRQNCKYIVQAKLFLASEFIQYIAATHPEILHFQLMSITAYILYVEQMFFWGKKGKPPVIWQQFCSQHVSHALELTTLCTIRDYTYTYRL